MKLSDKKGIKEIKKECLTVEGMKLEYTLMSIGGPFRAVYAIEICAPCEQRLSFFGFDKKRAASIFETIVSYSVTPCTLEDIAEDMAK